MKDLINKNITIETLQEFIKYSNTKDKSSLTSEIIDIFTMFDDEFLEKYKVQHTNENLFYLIAKLSKFRVVKYHSMYYIDNNNLNNTFMLYRNKISIDNIRLYIYQILKEEL